VKSFSSVTAAAAAAMYSVQESSSSSSNGIRINYVPLEDDETQPFEKKCAK